MTPTEVLTAARDLYNAVGDTYFSDTLMLNWIRQACQIFAKKAWLIERTYSTSTVAGTQDYSYPTNTIAIKRITVNGKKIKRINHRQDDSITLSNSTITSQGYPIYYTDWNYTISLRPIPDSIYTIQIFSYNGPQAISATSTLEIPELFHFDTVDYLLMRMFGKDKDIVNVQLHREEWNTHISDAIAYKARMKRTDGYATVQSEDILPVTILGEA